MATTPAIGARIDRQLVGRCARQGDPGSFRFYLSLEDELLRCLPPESLERARRQAAATRSPERPREFLAIFYRAQRMLQRQHERDRRLMEKDESRKFKSYRQMGLDPFLELIGDDE